MPPAKSEPERVRRVPSGSRRPTARRWTARSDVSDRSGEEGSRFEHDAAEPAVAELDEECQRFLEQRRGCLAVSKVGIDVRERPECLAVGATVTDGAQDVEALVGVRPRFGIGAGRSRRGQTVEPQRDSVRVAEPPRQPQAPLEERPGTIHLAGDHKTDREPIESPCDPSVVSHVLVRGQRLVKELLGGGVVAACP